MRRAPVIALLAAAVAPAPAAAGTVAHRTPAVGPKIADSDDPRGRRLAVLRVGTPGLRVLRRNVADRGVALDGGARRLATFTPRRRRVGDIDLSADRAVWAAQKTRSADYEAKPSGPARIVSRPL